jgi:hypothetical protein
MESKHEPWIFFLPDLHEFPEGSLPSPYRLMNPIRRLPPGLRLLAVGWLDGPIEIPTGETHPDVVSKLLGLGEEFLIDEGTAGSHCCYYCKPEDFAAIAETEIGEGRRGGHDPWAGRPESPVSKGHHLVRLGGVVYMCPALLPHYVLAHGYRPPDVFQEAVIHGTFLADDDLVHTGEDFREFADQMFLASAEAKGDAEGAAKYLARIEARRKELRRAGKTSGWRDRDTGVWRDGPASAARLPRSASASRGSLPNRQPFDNVLLDRPEAETTSERIKRLVGRLRKRLRG